MVAEHHVDGLAEASGLPLGVFRREHVHARIDDALGRAAVNDPAQLREAIARSPARRREFRRSVAISHTGFFRDEEQFAVLGRALAAGPRRRPVRAWSAGCANGLELWSLATLLHRQQRLKRSHLLGSDILEENVAEARTGSAMRRTGTPPPPVRPLFEVRDIVRDGAPGGRWDVVLCRNVGIYLNAAARQRLHAAICGALAPGGLLLLGRSEWLTAPAAFGVERAGPHLYRRTR